MSKKFELVKEKYIELKDGRKLYQIRALREIQNERMIVSIKKGELGGYVESEKNLSQEGNSWICQSARVYENALVKDGSLVGNKVIVRGNAAIEDDAYVRAMSIGKTIIEDNARIGGISTVGLEDPFVVFNHKGTRIRGNSAILGNTMIDRTDVKDSVIRDVHITACDVEKSIIYADYDLFMTSSSIQDVILYHSTGVIRDTEIQSSIHAGRVKIIDGKIQGGEFYNPLIKEGEVTFPSTNFHLLKERVERELTNVIKFGRVPKELSWKGEFPRIKSKEEVLKEYEEYKRRSPYAFMHFLEFGITEDGKFERVNDPLKIKNYRFFIDSDKVDNFCYQPPVKGVKIYPEHSFTSIPSSENLAYILCYKEAINAGLIKIENIDNLSIVTEEWKEEKGFDETGYVFIITVEK